MRGKRADCRYIAVLFGGRLRWNLRGKRADCRYIAVLLGGRFRWNIRRNDRDGWFEGWHAVHFLHERLEKGSFCDGILVSWFAKVGENKVLLVFRDLININKVHIVHNPIFSGTKPVGNTLAIVLHWLCGNKSRQGSCCDQEYKEDGYHG